MYFRFLSICTRNWSLKIIKLPSLRLLKVRYLQAWLYFRRRVYSLEWICWKLCVCIIYLHWRWYYELIIWFSFILMKRSEPSLWWWWSYWHHSWILRWWIGGPKVISSDLIFIIDSPQILKYFLFKEVYNVGRLHSPESIPYHASRQKYQKYKYYQEIPN